MDLHASWEYCTRIEKRRGRVWSAGVTVARPNVPVLQQGELRPWQLQIVGSLGQEPDDRTINWIYDSEGGKGKTALCRYILVNFSNVLFLSTSSTKDACHQIVKETKEFTTILVNLPRQAEGHISYAAFESIKDGLVYSGKYTGGFKIFKPPHLYIFANWLPNFNALSQDRWNVIDLGV